MDWHSESSNKETRKFTHWFSIRRASGCLFFRRLGYDGLKILGLSIKLRLFGRDIL